MTSILYVDIHVEKDSSDEKMQDNFILWNGIKFRIFRYV